MLNAHTNDGFDFHKLYNYSFLLCNIFVGLLLLLIEVILSKHMLQAYMYGFFKNKRIVLYDTLIQQV